MRPLLTSPLRGEETHAYLTFTTSRPLYWPQLGQTECGRLGCLQFGHGWIWTRASARCERRRPFFDLDSLTFGSAMDPGSLREASEWLPGRRSLRSQAGSPAAPPPHAARWRAYGRDAPPADSAAPGRKPRRR